MERFKKVIDALMEQAPSDAAAQTFFTKIRDGYSGVLRIASTQGKFVAKAVGHDVDEVIKNLAAEIRNQLSRWRAMRFEPHLSWKH